MTEIQITKWRDIPSMIVAKDGEDQVKISLPARFQEAIDEAAMRLGEADADAYMDGWTRDSWETVAGSATSAAGSTPRLLWGCTTIGRRPSWNFSVHVHAVAA
jgi:hypothetical protein